ncbi:hypothetical protein DFQ28_004652 [Apophysomyces sp. BC1034]|nr:hypothetical protein DFQ30_005650 [Apophysomyces sp. BC1015]KAG0183070.1 hypothetical protein DFQ29_000072 [Apophysomyces sp. BC1021]KAG0193533.1 hypothetical protein DFQ28_004652 [Apophysomyces sp. BC1034]
MTYHHNSNNFMNDSKAPKSFTLAPKHGPTFYYGASHSNITLVESTTELQRHDSKLEAVPHPRRVPSLPANPIQLRKPDDKYAGEYKPNLTNPEVPPASNHRSSAAFSHRDSVTSLKSEYWFANSFLYTGDEKDAPMPHYVLLPLGKTGDGKSSLLNAMFGYQEFKAASSARSVTSSIAERTGVWNVTKGDAMITVADTPGFGDSDGRDAVFQGQIKEYIEDLSDRLGIDAFLLVFKYNSPRIMSVLQKFADMMKDTKPGWWDHVVLVFTCVDYNAVQKPQITRKKQYITTQLVAEIKAKFGLAEAPPVAFVSSTTQTLCAFLTGTGDCDCNAAHKHKIDKMRLLKKAIASRAEHGRW